MMDLCKVWTPAILLPTRREWTLAIPSLLLPTRREWAPAILPLYFPIRREWGLSPPALRKGSGTGESCPERPVDIP